MELMLNQLKPIKMTAVRRILLVDDCDDIRKVFARLMRCFDFDVEEAENGQEACDAAHGAVNAGQPFDVILMDMQMPVMDGFSATSLLRSQGYEGRIIALTAMGDVRHLCLEAGCDDYTTKPISFDTILSILRQPPCRPRQKICY